MNQHPLDLVERGIVIELVSGNPVKRRSSKLLLIGVVGLVGSGKTTVARKIATGIGARVVRTDDIREILLKHGRNLKAVRPIAHEAARILLERGESVVMDSDLVDSSKWPLARALAREHQARLVFVRVTCDVRVALARTIAESYGSDSQFRKSMPGVPRKLEGPVARIVELWRRTPRHYRWSPDHGGTWTPRSLSMRFLATVDTTMAGPMRVQLASSISLLRTI